MASGKNTTRLMNVCSALAAARDYISELPKDTWIKTKAQIDAQERYEKAMKIIGWETE